MGRRRPPTDSHARSISVNALLNQGFYLQIHTAAHPDGEVRGQLIPASPGTTTSTTPTLKLLVDEILGHENAHVAQLEQTLGTNADPAPTL